jgi:lipopolysaccharide/colanic/teichoic acid biosynthesis glycosyltransferase
MLVACSPVVVLAALAVWLEDGGSPVFLSERIGRHGRPFRMIKLRTMRSGPPAVADSDSSTSRITIVGRILRKTKLDELPQFVNVLLGSMSLVGPRPHVPSERFVVDDPLVLSVRPGITDLSSLVFIDLGEVTARRPSDSEVRLGQVSSCKRLLACLYVRNRSLALDLRIVALTALAIFSRLAARPRVEALLLRLAPDGTQARNFVSAWHDYLYGRSEAGVFAAPPLELHE